jgi:hypothetical protein
MAQTGYDPDADERHAPGGTHDPLHDITGIDPDEAQRIHDREVTNDIARREGLFNKDGDNDGASGGSKKTSADKLRSAEGGSAKSGGGGLFNESGDDQGGLRGRAQNARNKVKNKASSLKKNKWFIGMVAGGGGGVIILVMILVILAGSLKLPGVTQGIEAYEFAQASREFSKTADDVTTEDLAVNATDDPTWYDLKGRFTKSETYENIRDTTWGKLDDYRPGKVIETLGKQNDLELRFKVGLNNREVFTGASYKGVDYDVEPVTGIARWTPGLNSVLKAKNAAAARSEFLGAVETDLKTNDSVATIIRSPTMLALRKLSGGSFAGWALDKFKNTEEGPAADAAAAQQMSEATQAGSTVGDNATTDDLSNADKAESETLAQDMTDPKKVETIIAHNGDDATADAAAENAVKSSALKSTVGVIDPLYKIFAPICIIYDGSVKQSEPSIDDNMNQQEDAFDQLAAEADQQKTGDRNSTDDAELGTAIGATNDEIGDVSQSIPYQLQSTGQADTSSAVSSEAGTDGGYTYSLFNLAGLSSSGLTSDILNKVTGSLCPTFSSLKVGVGLGIINGLVAIFTGGSSEAAEEGAGTAATEGVAEVADTVANKEVASVVAKGVEKDGVKTIQRSLLNRVGRFAFKQGITVGTIYGLTALAHIEIATRSGEANNGVAQGTDLVNEAGSGGNIEGNRVEQGMLFGRPLQSSEVSQNDDQDKTYLTDLNSEKSFNQRYFATDNPDSLFSHLALDIDANAHITSFGSVLRMGSYLTAPFKSFGALVGDISGQAHAAVSPADAHYGNVQFGWSNDEETLINSNDSYQMLENQEQLDEAAPINGMPAEQYVASQYAKCFGYTYSSSGNGDLDPTDTSGNLQLSNDNSLGHLLASNDVQRDDDGNVTDSGDCSKTNLSYNNPTYGDLVFRWRLAMRYDSVTNTMINEQSVDTSSTTTAVASTTPAPSSNPTPSSSSAAQLATQILANKNVDTSFSATVKQDLTDAAAGKPGTAGAMTSKGILELIAAVAAKHKVGISAIQSGGAGHCGGETESVCPNDPHYTGHAVDFDSLDGVAITGRNAPALTIITIAENTLSTPAAFGQSECGTTPTLPSGFTQFNDTCNHLHVQDEAAGS